MRTTSSMVSLTEEMIRAVRYGVQQLQDTETTAEIPDMVFFTSDDGFHVIEHHQSMYPLYSALCEKYSIDMIGLVRFVSDTDVITFTFINNSYLARLYAVVDNDGIMDLQFRCDMSDNSFEKLTNWFDISPNLIQSVGFFKRLKATKFLRDVKFVNDMDNGFNFIRRQQIHL